MLLVWLSLLMVTGCQKRALPAKNAPSPKAHLIGGELVFSDDFERDTLGEQWVTTHKGWTLKEGAVNDTNAKNAGLWLKVELPKQVRVEFTARSEELASKKDFPGDLKCEIFATKPEHQAGYVLINGGWSNRLDVIARLDEHGKDRLTKDSVRVLPGVAYRWAVVRTDKTIYWFRDGELILAYEDSAPIQGSFFGFNNWASNAFYDDLAIYRLD